MSEEKKHEPKKIIHVKDLVIKADNVYFEPTHQQRPEERSRPFDAFFGKRREEDAVRAEQVEEAHHEKGKEEQEEQEEALETEKREERRPFSWL